MELDAAKQKGKKNTLEKMMKEARTCKEEKKPPTPASRRKKNPGKNPGKKELVVDNVQHEKMRNLMKAWSDKAKAVEAREMVEREKEPMKKQASLVETRKRRFSQVQEEVNSYELWKRRKEEQRKHQNMTMGKVEEMQKEGVLTSVNRVDITDREKGKPESIKNITCCNLGEGLDQVQQEQALAGREDGALVGEGNLLVLTRLGEKHAGIGIFVKAEKAAASTPSMGETSEKRKLYS